MDTPVVLVIDDEASILKATQIALADQPVRVEVASNGRQGLRKVEELQPTVIVLDLLMPGFSGFQFLEELHPKEDAPYGVIILTGNYSDEDMQRCFDLGCYFFIRKPFGKVEISCMVNRCIAMKRLEADARSYRQQLEEMIARLARQNSIFPPLPHASGASKIAREQLGKLGPRES